MNTTWWLVVEGLMSFFEVLLMFIFFKDFLQFKDISKFKSRIYLICGFLLIFIGSTYFKDNPSLITVNALTITIIISIVTCKGKIYTRIFSGLLFYIITVLAEISATFIVAIINNISISSLERLNSIVTLKFEALMVKSLLLLVIIKVIVLFRKGDSGNLKLKYWLPLLLVPLISVYIVYVVLILVLHSNGDGIGVAVIGLIGLLYINIMLFSIFESLTRQMEKEYKYKIIEERVEMQTTHFNDLMEKRMEIQELLHDFKNHINCLHILIKNKDYKGIENYLSNLNKIEPAPKDIDTGNLVLDSVLCGKISLAEKFNIKVNCQVNIPENINIDSNDICIIIGNAMDNAIEAVKKINEPDIPKVVDVKFEMLGESLSITISNPMVNLPERSGKFFKSSKKEPGIHGVGLQSIERSVNKHNGILLIDTKGNNFKLEIVLNVAA